MAKIAFIGLGNMGGPMAANLVKAGFEVVGYNRSQDKVDALVEHLPAAGHLRGAVNVGLQGRFEEAAGLLKDGQRIPERRGHRLRLQDVRKGDEPTVVARAGDAFGPCRVAQRLFEARELRASQWWKRKRAAGICHHCAGKFPPKELTMDHLVPVVRGGKSTKGNLVPSCKKCNSDRKYRLPFEEPAQ
mgnify:CR=1 FL=1